MASLFEGATCKLQGEIALKMKAFRGIFNPTSHTFNRAHTKGVVQQRTLLRRVPRRVLETGFEKVLRRVLRRCLAACFTRRKGSEKGS